MSWKLLLLGAELAIAGPALAGGQPSNTSSNS
jgi:hypothetical protein